MRCLSVDPSNSHSVPKTPNIPIVTAGPPIILDTTGNNKRPVNNEDDLHSYLSKRRRTIVDQVDEMKRDLLAEELQNAKKIGLVLDETLSFLKRLNQSSNFMDKINGFINGH